MNIRRLWVKLALLFMLSAAIGFAVPSTLAYLTAQSDTIINTFTAPYFPPESTSVDVHVHKTIHSLGAASIRPEDFRFLLQKEDGVQIVLTTNADGHACAALTFAADDLGREHVYHLSEINDARPNVDYSTKTYEIRIALEVDADNRITARASVDGSPVQQIAGEFINIYHSPAFPPQTKDDSAILLWAVLMAVSGAGLLGISRRKKAA